MTTTLTGLKNQIINLINEKVQRPSRVKNVVRRCATGRIRTCAYPNVISRCVCGGGGLDVLMLTTLTSALSNIKWWPSIYSSAYGLSVAFKSVEDTKIYYTRSHYQKHQPHAVCVFRNPRLLMGASVASLPKYLCDTHYTQWYRLNPFLPLCRSAVTVSSSQ